MDSTLKDLQEFLATSKELLDIVDNIPLAATTSEPSQRTTSDHSTLVYVACPNNPKNHGRIPQDSLDRHLKKCIKDKETFPDGHVGYRPAARLKPVPESKSFYNNITNRAATTIVYKDKLSARQQKLLSPKGRKGDVVNLAGVLKDAGLFQLHGSQVYLYDPPASAPTSFTAMDLCSSKEKRRAYSEHIRLQVLIKQNKVHSESTTSSRTTISEGNDLPITRRQVMERVDQIRKRFIMEKRAEREVAQKKLERDRKKRRQGYKSESVRADKKNKHAGDLSAQAMEEKGEDEESEAIRKALAKGRSRAWAAAIEVFSQDAQLVATAESELQEVFEKSHGVNNEADNQGQRQSTANPEDGRQAKRTRLPESSHSDDIDQCPLSHRRLVEDRRYRSRPTYGKNVN